MEELKELYDIIFSNKKVVVITGAGISTLSGIPDFRGKNGLYSQGQNAEYMLSRPCFDNEQEKFYEFYKNNMMCMGFKPNIVHEVLAKLEERGLIECIITQNIDGLHTAAGSKNVVEIHGNGTRFYCTSCHADHTPEDHLESNVCKCCGGIVRPDIVLYNEACDSKEYKKAIDAINNAEKVIVLGTSLTVGTVYGLLNLFIFGREEFNGKNVFIVNRDRTQYDRFTHNTKEDLGLVFDEVNKKIHG